VRIADQGERAHIVADVVGEGGSSGSQGEWVDNLSVEAQLISPSRGLETVPLRQTAPGRYEGDFLPQQEGVYLVRVSAQRPAGGADREAELPLSQVTGFVRTYSPEYRAFGADEVALHRLVDAGGGVVLDDPAAVFLHDQDVVRTYTDVWPWLLGAAICLLPLDVGVRRVTVQWGDLRRAVSKVRARLRRRPAPIAQPSPRISRLLAAKERVEGGRPSSVKQAASEGQLPSSEAEISPVAAEPIRPEPEPRPPPSVSAPSAPSPSAEAPSLSGEGPEKEDGSMTARLLAAKRRARGRGQDKEE
jgi:hypothetical protein